MQRLHGIRESRDLSNLTIIFHIVAVSLTPQVSSRESSLAQQWNIWSLDVFSVPRCNTSWFLGPRDICIQPLSVESLPYIFERDLANWYGGSLGVSEWSRLCRAHDIVDKSSIWLFSSLSKAAIVLAVSILSLSRKTQIPWLYGKCFAIHLYYNHG